MSNPVHHHRRLPEWLRKKIILGKSYSSVTSCLAGKNLHTVCVEAGCPNRSECFSAGTATFLILGNICTRTCSFCGITQGSPLPIDNNEPERIAAAAKSMNLIHIVITSVTRDDLPDGGAAHFAECIRQCRETLPDVSVETLIPDFRGKPGALDTVLNSRPDVLNHNVETVPRLYAKVRPQADYCHSLEILARAHDRKIISKSGIMVGLGETDDEVIAVLHDFHDVGCRMVTIGQYLRTSKEHTAPERFVSPEQFAYFEEAGRSLGIGSVFAGPFVRSSFHAREVFMDVSGGMAKR
jgi:lipoyl synthase